LVGSSFASPHVLENIRIPKFAPSHKVHQELAAPSEKAHRAATQGDEKAITSIEKHIDELAAQIWGLTKAELKDIQESLVWRLRS